VNMFTLLRNNKAIYSFLRKLRNIYRIKVYRLINVHSTCYISHSCKISRDFSADAYSFVGEQCRVGPKVEIGKYVMFAPQVVVLGADHCFDKAGIPMIFSGRPELATTLIESDVWIGYGAILIAGIKIGRGSIVGASAVVTKNIPPYEIWAGIPARKIGDRFATEQQKLKHDSMLNETASEGLYCEHRG
jgi:acetyltransferase-like isoleucine patch superfamily enzyme